MRYLGGLGSEAERIIAPWGPTVGEVIDESGRTLRSGDGPPDGWTDLGPVGLGMSNLGHTIDDGLDEALRAGGVFARHAAWEFNGYVWFEGGQFHEQVWRHHVPRETLSAATLPDLMRAVNDRWGGV
jgi:hypothetical protein